MGHEIISTNLGGSSNISCANRWAMKQIYTIFLFTSPVETMAPYTRKRFPVFL